MQVTEYWFTAADAGNLTQIGTILEQQLGATIETPWNPFENRPSTPPDPWTTVITVSATVDPTWIAGIAHRHGCRTHIRGIDRWK